MKDSKLCVIFASPPASFPRTLGPRRCIKVDGPIGPETRIGRRTRLSFEQAIQGKMVPHRLLDSALSTLRMAQEQGREAWIDWRTYLPRRTRRLIVRVFPLHRSIYLPNSQAPTRASEDGTPQNHGERVLWPAIGIWKACKGVGAVGMGVVWAYRMQWACQWPDLDGCGAALRCLFCRGGGRAARRAHGL